MKSQYAMSGFAVMMLAYSAWRSFDYMRGSLQGVDEATKLLVSVAFLAFSELGLLLWLHVARPAATTDAQEAVSSVMIWVNFVGSMGLGLADLARHNTVYRIDLSALDPVLFLLPWLLVCANVAGYLLFSMGDSDERLAAAERRLKHEENSLEMAARRAAVEELRANKAGLAEKLAPHYLRDITSRVSGRTMKRFERAAGELPGPNGHKPQVMVYQDTLELENPKNGSGRGAKS